MNPSADIFEALAALPERTAAQRALDLTSARILRDADEQFGSADDEDTWTSSEVEDHVAEQLGEVLRKLAEQLPASSKRARELLLARAAEVAA